MVRKDRQDEVSRARAALVVAALRRTLLTYEELGRAVGIDGVGLRNQLPRVLDDLSVDCEDRGEPSLAALVVSKANGKPGSGWVDGHRPWHTEVRRVYAHWQPV